MARKRPKLDESDSTDLEDMPADAVARRNVPERREDTQRFHRDYIVGATDEQVDTDTEGRLVAATRQHAINSGLRPGDGKATLATNRVEDGLRVEVSIHVTASGAEGIAAEVEHSYVWPQDQRAYQDDLGDTG